MSRFSYVNGRYVPHSEASVSIEDRGFLLADGVYEVIGVINGRFADERGHLDRLERSMAELELTPPVSRAALRFIMRELVRKNRLTNAAIYLQVTRGVAKRDFKFPSENTRSSLVIMCWPYQYENNASVMNGVRACSVPDQRWARRDIKTVALLPQVLAKQKAVKQGVQEAIMVGADGYITEGASSNFWIYKDGVLMTRQADFGILKGVTRTAIFEIAREKGIRIAEKPFTVEDAMQAQEAFCSSATALIVPVVELDGHKIGDGKPGDLTREIYQRYRDYAARGDDESQLEWRYV